MGWFSGTSTLVKVEEEKFDIVTHIMDLVYKFGITNFHLMEDCNNGVEFNIKDTSYKIYVNTHSLGSLYQLRVWRGDNVVLYSLGEQKDDCRRLYKSLLNYYEDETSKQRQEEAKRRDMEIKAIIIEDRAKYLSKSEGVMDEVFADYNELQKAYNTVINITNKYSKAQFKLFNN